MDEFDAPRRMPSENSDKVPDLEELHRQTSLLFEEFLSLDDSFFSRLDEPSPASYDLDKEVADSPWPKAEARPRGSSLPSDVVADAEQAVPKPSATRLPVEQDETEETEKDNKMKRLAVELAKAGDALVSKYGSDVQDAEGKLIQLVKQEATNLTYERFSTAIDNLVGEDKNWTNFVFAVCVGRRVCKHSRDGFTYAKGYFQQYVQSYSTTIQETGDLESFVFRRGNPMPQ